MFEVINQVRLIIVAACERYIRPIITRSGFNALIHLLKTDVAAQLLGRHTNALFEFARQMPIAHFESARQLVDGYMAIAAFDDLKGNLDFGIIMPILRQTLGKIVIEDFNT